MLKQMEDKGKLPKYVVFIDDMKRVINFMLEDIETGVLKKWREKKVGFII
jgi:hypothetical protein